MTLAKDNMLYEVVRQHVGGKWMPSSDKAPLDEAERTGGTPAVVMGQQASCRRKYNWKKSTVLSDEKIRLTGVKTQEHYLDELRLVTALVEVKGKMVRMSFLTDNFEWSAYSVCQLYQCRWGVEVFFKELKQTLQLADFLGYNENAVCWQMRMALLAYLLLRFVACHNSWRHQFSRLFTYSSRPVILTTPSAERATTIL